MKIKALLLTIVYLFITSCGQNKYTAQEVRLAQANLESIHSIVKGSLFIPNTLKSRYTKDSKDLLNLYNTSKCEYSYSEYEKEHDDKDCQELASKMTKVDKELWKVYKEYHNEKYICKHHLNTIGVKTKKECKMYLDRS